MSILCYHSVQPGWASALAVEPADFELQGAWLARHRSVLPLATAVGLLDRSGRLPAGAAAVTFDDGFAALYDHAMPVLRRYRLPSTIFLVAQTLTPHGQPVDWVDNLGSVSLSTLTREQILDMQAQGVDFQSHSFAHHDLTRLGFDRCVQDLRESREILADVLGRSVDLLAYPRGRHDGDVRAAAERAGYSHAFALPDRAERPGRFAVPRVGIYRGNSITALRVKTSAPYLRVRTDSRVLALRDAARRIASTRRSATSRDRGR